MKILQILIIIFLMSCFKDEKKKLTVKETMIYEDKQNFWNDRAKFHKLKKLHVVGDFDGTGQLDTLFQHNFSKLIQSEIDSAADPFQVNWDTVVQWFYNQQSDIYLSFNKPKRDTIHLGTGQGLYCLINIGDINQDGKDELALVVDYCDFSNLNSCKIYSICNSKWTLLKQFGIYEGAFQFRSPQNISPIFMEIKEYLEKQNGIWKYQSYPIEEYEDPENVGKLKTLTLEKCGV